MALLVALLAIGGRAIAGAPGMLLFGGIGLAINFASYWFSDRVALFAHRAQPLVPEEAPQLCRIVERLCRRAGLPVPRLYLIPSHTPNAFATGRNPRHAVVAVTAGLLEILDERELEGVLAHELSHVRNRDILIATIAAAMAGLIAALGHMLRWGLIFGGLSPRNERDRGAGAGAIVWILVAPLIALLLQLAISRGREYAADASGARPAGDPEPLADALRELETEGQRHPYEFAGPATAHLFIVNPLRRGTFLNLFSTHPPIEERVRRLQALA